MSSAFLFRSKHAAGKVLDQSIQEFLDARVLRILVGQLFQLFRPACHVVLLNVFEDMLAVLESVTNAMGVQESRRRCGQRCGLPPKELLYV